LYNELESLTDSDINVIQHNKGKQEHLAYRGASIMAQSLEKGLWLSKADYDEQGPLIVHRKFL
jgi:actin-related protein